MQPLPETVDIVISPPIQPRSAIATRCGPLLDRSTPWRRRLVTLQGWRGRDVDCVLASGIAPRLAPATCAVGAVVAVITTSAPVLVGLSASAVVGAMTGRHPVERVHARWARRHGRVGLPRARAGRRFACAVAAVWTAAMAVADATGHEIVSTVLGVILAVLATTFTCTGLCVPSTIFTALFGAERASAAALLTSRRRDPQGSAR
jgi:hypothetical protein